MSTPTVSRLAALRQGLGAAGLDGLLVTTLVNVRYLSGFTGSNGALVVPVDADPFLVTDGRYRDQAAAETEVDVEVDRDLLGVAGARMTGRWGVETHTLSVDDHARLMAATSAELVGAGRPVESLREIKDDDEVALLREACRISVDALAWLWTQPLTGRTEREVARVLEQRMLELGAEDKAFDTIVAAGENSAVPHHQPTDRPVATGDLLKIDFGARVGGYHADCTRTSVVGPAADWQREIHAAVQVSQAAGVAACTVGADVAAVDAASRDALGPWLEHFTTGLGHGVGLLIHEDPFIARSHPGRLGRRTVLTVEPGIYLPGRGGVRIEDTLVVGASSDHPGPDVLTATTTDLLEIA